MASTKNRKVYKPEFKAKVALEAVRGKLTIELSADSVKEEKCLKTWA